MAGKTQYKREWNAENLDRVYLTVPKGYKETIATAASRSGDSVNAFILKAVKFYIEQTSEGTAEKEQAEPTVEEAT